MKLIYKPIGITPNELRLRLIDNNELSIKSCFAGRLDPMARGKMIFIENKELKDMNYYLNKSKTYEFELILGLSTDTDDILGIIDSQPIFLDNKEIEIKIINIINIINNLKINGQENQKYHTYSSYVLKKNGLKKTLWKWKLENNLSYEEIPSKNVKLYDINILEHKQYNSNYLLGIFIDRINKINKKYDFRQNKIISQWENIINKDLSTQLFSIKIEMKVSSGYYIRQFCYDLKTKLNYPLLVYDINRTNFDIN
jgi:tRNA U55 pseudouridine synthase TruB